MYFERFRAALTRYADGVHELGPTSSEAELTGAEARLQRALPTELRELYRSWNGLRLFADTFLVESLDRLAIEDAETLRLGEALGVPILCSQRGRVYEVDELGDRVLVGSTVERWLEVVMAREGMLVEPDGEWKDVFATGEEGLKPEVRNKRVRAACKGDPDAAAWQLEAAELAFELGALDEAEAALARAVAADAGAGVAWELYGGIQRRAARLDEAERSFQHAAESTRDPTRRAERWAEAARAAREAGRDPEPHAASARAAAGDLPERWLAEARSRLDEGDPDGALNLASLSAAVRPDDAAEALVRQARSRMKLKLL